MTIRSVLVAAVAVTVFLVTACGANGVTTPAVGATAGATASATAAPVTFDEFSTALCGSFTSLIRAVGNPDVNSPSAMSSALDAAVAAHDASAADRAATAMIDELEAGRRQAATAARWLPGQATMVEMDHLLAAFEANTMAKLAKAGGAGATVDPQRAFEQAGGVQAWTAVLQGIGSLPVPVGASPKPCKAFSGQI